MLNSPEKADLACEVFNFGMPLISQIMLRDTIG
jgi:hypothetical protein